MKTTASLMLEPPMIAIDSQGEIKELSEGEILLPKVVANRKPTLEVHIDGPNWSKMQISHGKMVDFFCLRQMLRNLGKVKKMSFYTFQGRSNREAELAETLRKSGFDVIPGKPGEDIDEIMREGISLTHPTTQAIAVFAGDGGYIHYLKEQQELGKQIFVFSSWYSLNKSYMEYPEFNYIDPFNDDEWEGIFSEEFSVPTSRRIHVNKYQPPYRYTRILKKKGWE
ncbi:MAG: hypothetical protein NTW50_03850 [Candidatus Berkelbacteria bacterium]|nr:hypothetical protein [Candidatus Berkelbacteria bacterium]